jgi:hypothetical protein
MKMNYYTIILVEIIIYITTYTVSVSICDKI